MTPAAVLPVTPGERVLDLCAAPGGKSTELAAKLQPGEHGLLALDWWNGNRSVLVDVDLTGMILGLTLQTKPEEIYRALIEATAFGMRVVVDNYEKNGVPIEEIFALGGISQKNAMAMQIYADVLNMPVRVITRVYAIVSVLNG